MSISVVWNGRAGSSAGISADEVQRALAAATGDTVTIEQVTGEQTPDACARKAIAAGATTVVAAGGDGTVSAVAAELVGANAILGVLPLGTSNSFAAALGIPAEIADAIQTIARRDQQAVDLAYVTGSEGRKAMILHCMIGIHADAIANASAPAKKRWGVLAYVASAMREIVKLEPFSVEIEPVGEPEQGIVRCQATSIAAANLAPLKTVLAHGPSHVLGNDGLIDVTIVAAHSALETIATAVHLYRHARDGEAATRDNIGSLSARGVRITTTPPQKVLVDGEEFGTTPVAIEVVQGALTVWAPPPPAAEGPPVEASLIGLPDLELPAR